MATDPRFLPPTPFSRLVAAHAVSMSGDACIAASLAGSLFFSSPADSSRGKVLLYLVVTMLPFAVVAPVLGPALDKRRSGRRVLVVVSMLGRAVLALLMARWISDPAPEGLLIYPLAFGILVLAKGYSVAKSSLVPALVGRDDELVRANSKLALVSAIATTVGGGPAFLVQELFGPEWSLHMAFAVFVGGSFLAAKIPPTVVAQSEREAELEREELHQPSILLAGSAMAIMRAAVGFLAFFAAFTLKDDLPALGLAAAMAVTGGFVGNIVGPGIRRMLREEQMLAASLLTTATFVLVALLLPTALSFALSSLAVAVGAAAGKLGFDSLLQRDGPDAARGRAFARFETRFQVAWVVGALAGIVPQAERLGLFVLALALGIAGVSYVAARRASQGRAMRTTLRPAMVDRAVGRATHGVRRRVRSRWTQRARRPRRGPGSMRRVPPPTPAEPSPSEPSPPSPSPSPPARPAPSVAAVPEPVAGVGEAPAEPAAPVTEAPVTEAPVPGPDHHHEAFPGGS